LIVITLPFPPSTNNLFLNGSKGRIRSPKYRAWSTEAGWEIARQRPPKAAGKVVLFYEFGEPDGRRRDVGNLEKAATDLLVEHGIIEADDNSVVREIRLKWSDIQGMRVTITPAEDGQ